MEVFQGQEININGVRQEIPYKDVKDAFKITNQPPYVILGTTNAGKTTLALDILQTFGPEVNYAYYVSQTQPTLITNDLKFIPPLAVRDPSNDIYQTLKNIWDDICMRKDAMNMKPTVVTSLLGKLYPSLNMEALIDDYLKTQNFPSENDREVARVEILTRLILDKCLNHEEILRSLADEEREAVNGCISGSCKTILILDDLSGLINLVQSSSEFVQEGTNRVKKGKAFINLLKDILTRCRHMNCLCCLFIHDLGVLSKEITNNLQNLILMDMGAYAGIKNLTRFNASMINTISQIIKQIEIFNENRYRYYWIMASITSGMISIGKAKLCKTNIKVSPALESLYAKLTAIKIQEAQTVGSNIMNASKSGANGWATGDNGWATSSPSAINFNTSESTSRQELKFSNSTDSGNIEDDQLFKMDEVNGLL